MKAECKYVFRGRFTARHIKDFNFENNWLTQSDKNLINRTKGTAKLLSKLKFIISPQRLFTQLFSNILYFFSRVKIQNNKQTILQGISNHLKTQWQHNRIGSFLLAMWLQVAWWCSSQGILKGNVSGDGIIFFWQVLVHFGSELYSRWFSVFCSS